MTDNVLRLRPATPAEFGDWLPRHEAGYAELIAASGAMSPEEAREKARRDTERVFPAGLDSPGQLVFRVLAGDEPVGTLWLAVPGPDDALMAWVYDIEIDPACRGRGYGRAAMLLAEAEARARGMTSIGLNVHGQNMVARALYDSLGYEVTAQQMKKALLFAGGDQAGLVGEHDSLRPVAQAQLHEDAADVSFGGLFGDDEGGADLRVGHAAGDEGQHLGLARSQPGGGGLDVVLALALGPGAAGEVLDQAPGHRGRERLPAQGRAGRRAGARRPGGRRR